MPNLKGKVALITGASSGIGAGTAIYFAQLGCSLALNGRNESKMSEVVEQCFKEGIEEDQIIIVIGDLTDEGIPEEIVSKTIERFGRLDILVNNAGLFKPTSSLDLSSIDNFDLVIRTNLRAPFRMIQVAVPYLRKSKGNIVNVSSVVSDIAFSNSAGYGSSKAGLDHITKSVALELSPDQVRVNSVNPGSVITDILIKSGLERANDDKLKSTHALGRAAATEEIAKAIAFLASDDASFVTGTIFLVDGGFSLMRPT